MCHDVHCTHSTPPGHCTQSTQPVWSHHYKAVRCEVSPRHGEILPLTDETRKVSRQAWACQFGALIKLTLENAWSRRQGLQARGSPCSPRPGWGWWPAVLALLHHGWGLLQCWQLHRGLAGEGRNITKILLIFWCQLLLCHQSGKWHSLSDFKYYIIWKGVQRIWVFIFFVSNLIGTKS